MKENFIKSTLILAIGGFITKILGMFIKIIMARIINPEVLGIYMLILPTFILFINLAQFGMPLALAKLISEGKNNNKNLIFSAISILIFINIIIIIFILLSTKFISFKLLHNKNTYYAIKSMAFVIPFTTISSICRSYFFGKNKVFPHVMSNIVENIVRILLIVVLTPLIIPYGIKFIVAFLVLYNIISEIFSTIILIFFIPKKAIIKKNDLKPKKYYINSILKIGIPNTITKLIGSIGYFFEPIILSNLLLYNNCNIDYITREYGILNGYVIPLILLPSFFTMAISQALLPNLSHEYSNNNIRKIKKRINQAISISLIIGFISTIILITKPKLLLNFLYNTNSGINYIKFLAPICIFQYIESILSTSLDSFGKSKDNLYASILSTGVRTISLIIFSFLNFKIWSLVFSISLNIIITTFYLIKKVKQYLT